MVEQRKPMANYYNSWKFTGKELDSLSREAERFGKETGLYYFGARYYQPSWSILALSQVEGWLSVDPMAENYPLWNPYNYVLQSPLINIDPDGRAVETVYKNETTEEEVEIEDGIDKTLIT